MKVLALSAQVPYPPHHGKAMRDYYLHSGLAVRHPLRLLCMGRAPEIAAAAPLSEQLAFEAMPQPEHTLARRLRGLFFSGRPDLVWRAWSLPFRRLLAGHLLEWAPDLLLVEGLEMAAYGLWARRWLRRRGRSLPALLLDEHNAEYLLQQRAAEIAGRDWRRWPAACYSRLQARRLARFEALACRQYHQVVAVSAEDRQALLRIAPAASITVVPNGVDTDRYAPLGGPAGAGPPCLLFTGRMDFRPNVDAVRWFCAEIWPALRAELPQARFLIVGRDPAPQVQALAALPGVEVSGAVADDRPYLGRADVYVLPMRFGGGVRFKLLQALSMGRALVSTTLGAEGVQGLQDGQHLFLADNADEFASRTLQLLRRPDLRERLGQAGREHIRAHYDWGVLRPRLERALLEAVSAAEGDS